MTDTAPGSVNDASQSADSAGLGSSPAAAPVKTCKYAEARKKAKFKAKPIEYCDIKQLQLALSGSGKTQTITIDHCRTTEAVDQTHTPKKYWSALGSHDLVVEALADIEDTTGADHAASADRKPLDLKATAADSVSHTSITPKHPHCEVGLPLGASSTSDGGAPVSARYFAPGGRAYARTTWGQIWPFGDDRVRTYDITASSCGNVAIPKKPIGKLSAQLVVLPYEEWSITIGLQGVQQQSRSSESNLHGNQDGDSGRRVTSTTTVKKRTGLFDTQESSTKTTNMETPTGLSRTRTETTDTELSYRLLAGDSEATTTTKQNWRKGQTTKTKTSDDYRKVSIKRSVGGRESEIDVSETIKHLVEIKEIFDDISKLFDSVKIGWSLSMSYELLAGNLNFGWGIRWPASYAEQSRVWYVERFLKASGQCDVVTGSVTGFFGFAVDPWYAPVTIEVGAYLSASAKISVSASFEYSYTSSVRNSKDKVGSLDPSATIKFEAGGKANGRAFGYSVESRLAIESSATFTMHGEISANHPPYLKGSLTIGAAHEAENSSDTAKADAIRLVGEVIITGETVRRRKIKPIVLCSGVECFKDKYFWGEAPKEG